MGMKFLFVSRKKGVKLTDLLVDTRTKKERKTKYRVLARFSFPAPPGGHSHSIITDLKGPAASAELQSMQSISKKKSIYTRNTKTMTISK
jgi:hypothetical protein